ncbi:hypothetical protein HOV93_03610 [Planctomycetes bacterium FF15]|uniref:Uncharacterized protein n=1 Tax=Bremerella alba TaxID=980252 RepID=A0A7V9A5E9_9BACT|nr:hypothetical protein [Bremerella alba]
MRHTKPMFDVSHCKLNPMKLLENRVKPVRIWLYVEELAVLHKGQKPMHVRTTAYEFDVGQFELV